MRLWPLGVIVIIGIIIMIIDEFWGLFKANHEEIRTLALLAAAIGGFLFAWWRARIADRQATTAQREADTAEKNLLNEQFKSGVELFTYHDPQRAGGSLVTRVSGVSVLAELARLHPKAMHVRVMDQFATFLRHNPSVYGEGHQQKGEIHRESPDNLAIMNAINGRTDEQKRIEREQDFDLRERLKDTVFPLGDD